MFNVNAFKNPPAAYRIHPFWFWNGDMDEAEITHQIKEMAEKGVGGFFICPRQGLTVPYLSQEWFQKVKFATEIAKSFEMDVWLYDEYPYPSGMAGGEVTLIHPDAKHYTLEHRSENVQGGGICSMELPWGRVLSAKAVPVDPETGERVWEESLDLESYIGNDQVEPVFQKAGLTAYNQKRFFTYKTVKALRWTAPEGSWEVHCFLEVELNDFKYYGTFVDPCNKEAIKTFIELTHGRYSKSLGEEFGKTVKGIFSDETGLLGRIPWSPKLPEFFEQQHGYDLKEYLYALVAAEEEQTAKVRYDYFQAIHLLLRESYHKQIHDWCEENGIQYVAELPSVRMAAQSYGHIPGGDSAHEKLGRSLDWILNRYTTSFRANPKMVSSLSNQLGRERALIECFHSVGWSMTLQDAKWMLDRLAAFSINFYNFHAFFYTLDGLTKHDAPPSQFLQNPYWQHFRTLGDYAGRLGYVMSCGIPERSIAVLDPTTSLWSHMGNPFHDFQYSGKEDGEKEKLFKLKADWSAICRELLLHHKGYDHLDPEILSQAEISDGKIKIGHGSYSVLILPPLSNLEEAAWKQVKTFLDQGGTVIANGLLPYEVIDTNTSTSQAILDVFGADASAVSDYWNAPAGQDILVKGKQKAYFIPSGDSSLLLKLVENHVDEEITFASASGKKSFLTEKRRLSDSSTLIFMTNQEEGEQQGTLSISYPCEFHRLNLQTGESEALAAVRSGRGWKLELHFDSFQSELVQINRAEEPSIEHKGPEPWKWEIDSKGDWEVRALQENAIRFDTFDMVINPKNNETDGRSVVGVKTFIDQCADLENEQALPVAFHQVFGTPMKAGIKYPVACVFEKKFFTDKLPGTASLLMDEGAVFGPYQILLNGQSVEGFEKRFVYDHSNLVCDVLPLLKKGENLLRIEVEVEHDWDGVVDAVYLLGDFGVAFNVEGHPVLTDAAVHSTIKPGPYESYPYYAGTLSFTRRINLERMAEEEDFVLRFTDLDPDVHDCIEVLVNGQSLGVRAWTPYEWEGKSSVLHSGENQLEIKVTNTLIGLLEGKYFDYREHKLHEVSSLKLRK
ncbi:glycosyl hydrolase [Mesobacillus foraminis]|uniref:Alpha-L-rhamnosidase-like protein n=1 Tax=Mesobacillus foraminis TaxID=279826 RepID=A0A4R2B746_9BACI|nr:glycosyl hydrolase [Mesobacillus foraminis]TCN22537.1 alpha-L-rhamnosidase-like protein [Mesobacillus foraminis]